MLADPHVRRAYLGPLAALMTAVLAQQLVLGLLIGGLYGLAAAALSLVFGVLKVLGLVEVATSVRSLLVRGGDRRA